MDKFHIQYAISRANAQQKIILHKLEMLHSMKSTISVKNAIYTATEDLKSNEIFIARLENQLKEKTIIKSK